MCNFSIMNQVRNFLSSRATSRSDYVAERKVYLIVVDLMPSYRISKGSELY